MNISIGGLSLQTQSQSQQQPKQPDISIDFEKEIKQFTNKSTQRLEMIQYQYNYVCIHPKQDDIAIVLQSTFLPSNSDLVDLIQKDETDINVDEEDINELNDDVLALSNKKISTISEVDMKAVRPRTLQKFGCLFDQDYNLMEAKKLEEENKRILNVRSKESSPNLPKLKSVHSEVRPVTKEGERKNDKSVLGNAGAEKHEHGSQKVFFKKPVAFKEDQSQDAYRNTRYSISFYRLNYGVNPVPIKEYGFHGFPLNSQFYISHCGNFIYYFLMETKREYRDFTEAKWCVILDVNTLQEVSVITFKKEENVTVVDSALFNNGLHLYMRTSKDEHIFYNTQSKAIEWRIDTWYTQSTSSQDDSNILDNSDEINWCIYEVCFRESDQGAVFFFCYKEDQAKSSKYIFKATIGQPDLNEVFSKKNQIWSCLCNELPHVIEIYYNSYLTQFVFFDDSYAYYLNLSGGKEGTQVKQIKSNELITSRQTQKNTFLFNNIIVSFNVSQNVSLFSLNDKQNIAEIKKWIAKDSFDVRQLTNGDIVALGTRDKSFLQNSKVAVQEISIRYLQLLQKLPKNVKQGSSGQPTQQVSSYKTVQGKIQEFSQFRILYPFVFYMKSRTQLIIQSIINPNIIKRIYFNEYLITFVNFNDQGSLNFNDSLRIKENETISFLCERNGKVYLNFLLFNSLEDDQEFKLIQTVASLDLRGKSYDDIKKVSMFFNFVEDKDKDTDGGYNITDYILVYQYLDDILFKALYSDYTTFYNKTFKAVPFFHKFCSDIKNDELFFLQKEGLSILVRSVSFKEEKNEWEVQKVFDFKSDFPRLFTYHMDHFYLISDEFEIFKLYLDQNKFVEKSRYFPRQIDIDTTLIKQIMKHEDDTVFEISDSCLYWLENVYTYYDQEQQQKDTDFFDMATLFSHDGILYGPKKLKNPQYNVYVVQNFNIPNYVEADDFFHNVPRNQDDFNNQIKGDMIQGDGDSLTNKRLIEEEEKDQIHSPATNKSFMHLVQMSEELEGGVQQEDSSRKTQQVEKKLGSVFEYDQYLFDGAFYKLEMIFMNPIDQNFIQYLYQSDNDSTYPTIQFSTFLEDGNVLVMIANRLMIFNKYGQFQHNVNIWELNQNKGPYHFQTQLKEMNKVVDPKTMDISKRQDDDWVGPDKPEDLQAEASLVNMDSNMDNKLILQVSDNTRFYILKFKDHVLLYELKKDPKNKKRYIFSSKMDVIPYFPENCEFNSFKVMDDGAVYQLNAFTYSKENKVIQKCCQAYRNEIKSITSDKLKAQFPLVAEYMKDLTYDADADFRMIFVQDYLFICSNQIIEYRKILNLDEPIRHAQDAPRQTHQVTTTRMNVTITKPRKIIKILATGRDDLVQLIIQDSSQKHMISLVWDILTNMEYSSHVMYDPELLGPYKIVKGVDPKLNYYCTETTFQDFQFYFPLKFLRSYAKNGDTPFIRHFNQKNVSRDCSQYLDISKQNTIINSFTIHNLLYFKQLEGLKRHQIDETKIMIDHFAARIHDTTIFHIKQDLRILEILLEEAEHYYEKSGRGQTGGIQQKHDILLNILYPNKNKISAFDICIEIKSPKIIEVYLKIMILLNASKEYRFSKFIRKHFDDIFSLNIAAFYKYLDTCTFQHLDYQESIQLNWNYTEDEVYLYSHTSILTQDLIDKIQQKKTVPTEEKKAAESGKVKPHDHVEHGLAGAFKGNIQKSIQAIKHIREQVNFMQLYEVENEQEVQKGEETSNVIIEAMEFEWAFKGRIAEKFIADLAFTKTDELFGIYVIKVVIQFLWKSFYIRILLRIFLPFLAYFFFYLVYVTYVFQQSRLFPDSDYFQKMNKAFIAITFVGLANQLSVEGMHIYRIRQVYFFRFWNIISLTSLSLNIAFLICDIKSKDTVIMEPLGAASVLVMWVKLFYFLKIFHQTGNFLRMIIQVFADLSYFAIAFWIAIFAFANTFYLLSLNCEKADSMADATSLFDMPFEVEYPEYYLVHYYLHAIIYSFLSGVGEFNTDSYDITFAGKFIWLVWLLETILIKIILLSIIVSIMNNTFANVTELGEFSKLKELCFIMYNYEYVINREKEFKNAKFIIIAKLEKGSKDEKGVSDALRVLESNSKDLFHNIQREDKAAKYEIKSDFMQGIQECQDVIKDGQDEINKNLDDLMNILRAQK